MRENIMDKRLELSEAHARWLEDMRKIPSELAAEMGVVTIGGSLAFADTRNGVTTYHKIRKEVPGARKPDYFIEPKGTELCLWNEDSLSDESSSDTAIVTEGELDGLSFLAAGLTHVVSVPNGSPLDKPGIGDINPADDRAFRYLWDGGKLKEGLQRFKRIILATDADQKGRVLRDELAIRLGRPRCWFVTYPEGCKDANEVLVAHGTEAVQKLIAEAKPIVPSRLVPFSEIPSRADAASFSLGFRELDDHLRIVPPQLIVVTGRPQDGKSQWTVAMGANLARLNGLKGAILQFEDQPDRNRALLLRYAQTWSRSEQHDQHRIREKPEAWVDRMFVTISPSEDLDEDTDFNLEWLKAAIEEAATRHGCKWVLIDPWNEVEHLWGRQHTEATYLNHALRELKRLGRRFQIAIIIVAHMHSTGGREASVAHATLYDINGGAAWNNKADVGVIVLADDAGSPDRWIKIAKSKDFVRFGRPGIVAMRFDSVRSVYTIVPNKKPNVS
jgi:twinkle protein